MIKEENGKVILDLGYGDIVIGWSSYPIQLFATGIKPPQNIGSSIDECNIERITKTYSIDILDEEDILRFDKLLNSISDDNRSFEFNNFTFNFNTDFWNESLDVVKKYFDMAISSYLLLLAA